MSWHTRFRPMSPAPYTASGEPFTLQCIGDCGGTVASTAALCDVTDKPGSFYCKPCAARYACEGCMGRGWHDGIVTMEETQCGHCAGTGIDYR